MKTKLTERKGAKGLIIALLLAVIMIVGVVVPSEARLASTNRHAAVMEACYALSPDLTCFTNRFINGDIVSVWDYLATDLNAYRNEKPAYCCDKYGNSYASVISEFFSEATLKKYAYNLRNDYVGRGGQCKFFVDTLLFRSEAIAPSLRIGGTHTLPSYDVMFANSAPIGKVQQGDVIFVYKVHVALVIAILARDAYGNATSVDVIDSNYVNGDGNETIGRHRISINYTSSKSASRLQNYKIYTGVSYYNELYHPW